MFYRKNNNNKKKNEKKEKKGGRFTKVVCPYLPNEIVAEILMRLPHECVIKFKVVCKSWYNIIKDKSFVSDHFHHHSKFDTNTSLLFVRRRFKYYLTDRDRNQLMIPSDDQSRPTMKLFNFKNFNRYHVRGLHCNGIIAFPTYTKIAFINPTLKQSKFLPTKLLPKFKCVANGFGYDERTHFYKYVKIFASVTSPIKFRAQVCTLFSSGCGVSSLWREINMIKLNPNAFFDRDVVYLKSVCYWVHESSTELQIVSFDMSDEKFGIIQVPFYQPDFFLLTYKLKVWKDKLVLLLKDCRYQDQKSIEIWVMVVESDNAYHWTKHLIITNPIPIHCCTTTCLDFLNDEELLIRWDEFLISYNIRTKKMRRLQFSSRARNELEFSTLYSKSLVSLLDN
ncbi:hypothetical protein F8388_021444 [Cannabis sativa]|uniref:F-box domain-containing protein n=1 Tax=Cannabis sativa TaxID=3483 RepID=A0A7J6FDR7_CANSA|nr:hypothetical protein F8388_021444 [Cannabis sativa]